MGKKSKKKKLHDRAWNLQSKYIRRKEKGVCYTCGDKRDWRLQNAGHYIHKDSVDFDPINIHCQCVKCNKWKSGNLGIYAERLIREYGQAVIEDLRYRSNQVKKYTIDELEGLINKYGLLLTKMDSLD